MSKLSHGVRLRHTLASAAHQLLSQLRLRAREPVTVAIEDEFHRVEVTIGPAAGGSQIAVEFPGRFLSDIEKCIWDAVVSAKRSRPEDPVKMSTIAKLALQSENSTFATILANLVARGVLISGTRGYDLPEGWLARVTAL